MVQSPFLPLPPPLLLAHLIEGIKVYFVRRSVWAPVLLLLGIIARKRIVAAIV